MGYYHSWSKPENKAPDGVADDVRDGTYQGY